MDLDSGSRSLSHRAVLSLNGLLCVDNNSGSTERGFSLHVVAKCITGETKPRKITRKMLQRASCLGRFAYELPESFSCVSPRHRPCRTQDWAWLSLWVKLESCQSRLPWGLPHCSARHTQAAPVKSQGLETVYSGSQAMGAFGHIFP